MNKGRLELFAATYRAALGKAVAEYPDEYAYGKPVVVHGNLGATTLPAVTVESVADKMIAAVERGSFSKEGRAFKATCRTLGIKHTYKAIDTFLGGR